MLTSDPANPGFNNQAGAMRSVGFELEGKAALTDNLNLIASVSRVDAEFTKDNDGLKGRHPVGVSPLTASAWVDYQMPADTALVGLGFGVGVRYVRSSPGTSYAWSEFNVPSFNVYDGMISYDLERSPLTLLIESFGFKRGMPVDADLVFDVRCLPNPYWIPDLRAQSGLDQPVADYLAAQPDVEEMFVDISSYLLKWLPRFAASNRAYVTIAIGCTGGHHRSVYLTERLGQVLQKTLKNVQVRHRDLS